MNIAGFGQTIWTHANYAPDECEFLYQLGLANKSGFSQINHIFYSDEQDEIIPFDKGKIPFTGCVLLRKIVSKAFRSEGREYQYAIQILQFPTIKEKKANIQCQDLEKSSRDKNYL